MGATLFPAENSWFDEGHQPVKIIKFTNLTKYVNTGGINSTSSDAFKQGIEIQQDSQYIAGLVKIGSGEPGMQHRQPIFGEAWQTLARDGYASFTDGVSVDNASISTINNGVIEPLDIRAFIEFGEHTVNGELANAGHDALGRALPIVTLYQRNLRMRHDLFIDGADSMGNVPIPVASSDVAIVIQPFDDIAQYKAGVLLPTSADNTLLSALRAMTPATDSYVTPGMLASSSGPGYDCDISLGTDSIAFVGQER